MKRRTTSGITTFLTIGLLVIAIYGATTPGAAQASATGSSYFGNLGPIKGIPVYRGAYTATIKGKGTYVSGVTGAWWSIGNICNWSITAEFFDSKGRWYRTYTRPTRYGCSRTGSGGIAIDRYMKRGSMCSTLKQNGGRITSVCHNIY